MGGKYGFPQFFFGATLMTMFRTEDIMRNEIISQKKCLTICGESLKIYFKVNNIRCLLRYYDL